MTFNFKKAHMKSLASTPNVNRVGPLWTLFCCVLLFWLPMCTKQVPEKSQAPGQAYSRVGPELIPGVESVQKRHAAELAE